MRGNCEKPAGIGRGARVGLRWERIDVPAPRCAARTSHHAVTGGARTGGSRRPSSTIGAERFGQRGLTVTANPSMAGSVANSGSATACTPGQQQSRQGARGVAGPGCPPSPSALARCGPRPQKLMASARSRLSAVALAGDASPPRCADWPLSIRAVRVPAPACASTATRPSQNAIHRTRVNSVTLRHPPDKRTRCPRLRIAVSP